MAKRKNKPYKNGELETILSLAPTRQNIKFLSELLGRTEGAIKIVYKIAFEHGSFGTKGSGVQEKKVLAAKKRVGIAIGRTKPATS